MCTHFAAIPLTKLEEAIEAVRRAPESGGCEALATKLGEAVVGAGETQAETGTAEATDTVQDVYPGSSCPVILVREGRLAAQEMAFGYEAPWLERPGRGGKLVANARIENALGRPEGMWAESLARRRCLVPAWGFYEPHRTRTRRSPRTGRTIKQQVFFSLAGSDNGSAVPEAADGRPASSTPAFLAGIYQDGRFAIVTCAPNASVSPVHDRMPIVLRPAEARVWLGPRYATLADRTSLPLASRDA